jgi:hypothetical protein
LNLFNEYPHGVDGVLVFCIVAMVCARFIVRARTADQILFLVTLALALHAQRHTPYFYLLGTPIVLVEVQRRLAAFRAFVQVDRFLTIGRPGIAALACIAAAAVALGPAYRSTTENDAR